MSDFAIGLKKSSGFYKLTTRKSLWPAGFQLVKSSEFQELQQTGL